jgi:hypothetical protein
VKGNGFIFIIKEGGEQLGFCGAENWVFSNQGGERLNDGSWHHVGVTFTEEGERSDGEGGREREGRNTRPRADKNGRTCFK